VYKSNSTPKKAKAKKKEASSEDEVAESSQQEEEADDQQVDQELEETGFVGGSDKGETKANCFTCKRELDVEEDAVVVCQHCNRYLCKPINASSSSSSFVPKPPCAVPCLDPVTDECPKKDGFSTEGYFCNASHHDK